ncbi:APC family permease [Demequina sp.]|uniref:APC family permease n=1 Tax=Demequina sp. TaxID=2050685 RepID=UPI003D1308DB
MSGLARRLGLGDAVAIGLGSMLGAGVFSAFAPAAAVAGAWLLCGLAIAAVVALCNATSSAQLAAQFPESGGTYVYGRRLLGEWPGFVAGWCFVVGKTASCAAMALTAAAYLAPSGWSRPLAVALVMAVTIVTSLGVNRTAAATRIIVGIVLVVLALVLVAGALSPHVDAPLLGGAPQGAYGVLQSAGLLFFAFAGYARIATMGEEVRNPGRTIPRAILIALASALLIYLAVALAALATLGPAALGASRAPLVDVATAGGWSWAAPVVSVGAGVAAIGALLALLAGITRTGLAMARTGDLPRGLSIVHPTAHVPRVATLWVGGAVVLLVLIADLRTAIGFSSFGVLLYYLVANLAALRQDRENRRYPRALAVLGVVGCVTLAVTLPLWSIGAAAVTIAVGVAIRVLRLGRAAAQP